MCQRAVRKPARPRQPCWKSGDKTELVLLIGCAAAGRLFAMKRSSEPLWLVPACFSSAIPQVCGPDIALIGYEPVRTKPIR